MSKQTALNWLLHNLDPAELSPLGIYNIIRRAKIMEKEQLLSAHINGQSEWDTGEMRDEIRDLSEQYYEDTYGDTKD